MVSANRLRAQLAAWLTGPNNPYFARAAVNKLWANFFGRGIVTPDRMRSIDDELDVQPVVAQQEIVARARYELAGLRQRRIATGPVRLLAH